MASIWNIEANMTMSGYRYLVRESAAIQRGRSSRRLIPAKEMMILLKIRYPVI